MPNLPIPTRLTSVHKLFVIPFIAFLPLLGIYFGFYLGRQSAPSGTLLPTPTLGLEAWVSFSGPGLTFQLPSSWRQITSSAVDPFSAQNYVDPSGNFHFLVIYQHNLDRYSTIDEHIGMPYPVTKLLVAGQGARQPLPRAGSENVNSVSFFNPNSSVIYTLELQSGAGPEATPDIVLQGQKLFAWILSTVRVD